MSPLLAYTLKIDGLFQPNFGSNMDKPSCIWLQAVGLHFKYLF